MPDIKPAASAAHWDDYSYSRAISALTVAGDPDIVLQELGKTRASLRVLETDDEITAALETRREAVLATSWNLVGDDGEHKEATRRVLERWIDDILRGAWNAVPYGYSVLRCSWSQDRRGRPENHPEFGIVAPLWIGEWPMERFAISNGGQLRYKRMDTGEMMDAMPPEFFMTRRNATWRNPYGEALLSRLYWPWFFRYNGWRFWMQFIERFGDPIVTGSVMTPDEFVKVAQASGFASVLAVNSDESIDVQGNTSSGEHQRLMGELNKRVQKVILGQTLTSDTNGKGSYAAARVHDTVRQDKRLADLRLLRPTVQEFVNQLWTLNRWVGDPPRFEFDAGVSIDSERTGALKDLRDTGWAPTEQLLGRLFGDVKPGDFEPVEAAASGQGSASLQLEAGDGRAHGYTPAQQQIEDLVDASVENAPSPISDGRLRALIAEAKSPEHLDELLAQEAADADPGAYRQLLERALFAADVVGYVMAEKGEQ